jgi:hypothetical protein
VSIVIPDEEHEELHREAIELFKVVFSRWHYRRLSRMLKDEDRNAIERYVYRLGKRRFDDSVCDGVIEILILAAEQRGMRTSVGESDEFQLGRLLEFCLRCADGETREIHRIADSLPVWLKLE